MGAATFPHFPRVQRRQSQQLRAICRCIGANQAVLFQPLRHILRHAPRKHRSLPSWSCLPPQHLPPASCSIPGSSTTLTRNLESLPSPPLKKEGSEHLQGYRSTVSLRRIPFDAQLKDGKPILHYKRGIYRGHLQRSRCQCPAPPKRREEPRLPSDSTMLTIPLLARQSACRRDPMVLPGRRPVPVMLELVHPQHFAQFSSKCRKEPWSEHRSLLRAHHGHGNGIFDLRTCSIPGTQRLLG